MNSEALTYPKDGKHPVYSKEIKLRFSRENNKSIDHGCFILSGLSFNIFIGANFSVCTHNFKDHCYD